MKVTRADKEGVAILRLTGEFDSFETDEVRQNFEKCLKEGRRQLILDLSGMTFANSTTIAYLVTAQKRAKETGGSLLIAEPGDFLRKTLKTLGLDRLLALRDSVDDAIAELQA